MEVPHGADVRVPRIRPLDARGVRHHAPKLLPHGLRRLRYLQGVAVGLAHLSPVDARNLGRRREERLRLHQQPLSEEVVEAPHRLPAQLQVRALVLPHRHEARPVQQDIRRHQYGIAQKGVGAQVLVLDVVDLLLIRGVAVEPAQGGDHPQGQGQFRVLRHVRLDKDRALLRVQPHRQPVQQGRVAVLPRLRRFSVIGHQGVPVCQTVKAIVLLVLLQFDKITQRPGHVSQVQRPRGPHRAENPLLQNRPILSFLSVHVQPALYPIGDGQPDSISVCPTPAFYKRMGALNPLTSINTVSMPPPVPIRRASSGRETRSISPWSATATASPARVASINS